MALQVDVTDRAAVDSAVHDALDRFGRADGRYHASTWVVDGLTESLAHELAGTGVHVTGERVPYVTSGRGPRGAG